MEQSKFDYKKYLEDLKNTGYISDFVYENDMCLIKWNKPIDYIKLEAIITKEENAGTSNPRTD